MAFNQYTTLLLDNPTSLWGFEVERVAAGAVAPPVEGHDHEAVLGEGPQRRHGGVRAVPGERQRVLLSVAFLGVRQAAQTPPVHLKRGRTETSSAGRQRTMHVRLLWSVGTCAGGREERRGDVQSKGLFLRDYPVASQMSVQLVLVYTRPANLDH